MSLKRIIGMLMSLCLLTSLMCNSVIAQSEKPLINDLANVSFKYKITPDSTEWKEYDPLELKEMLNIPNEELSNMDTETLLDTVLNYPYLPDIYAFNDSLKAIDYIADNFNGLKALLERDDLKDALINENNDSTNYIMELDESKVDYKVRYRHYCLESLLLSSKIYNKLQAKEKENLVSNSQKIADRIKTRPIIKRYKDKFQHINTQNLELSTLLNSSLTASDDSSIIDPFKTIFASPGEIIDTGFVRTPNFTLVSVFEREDMSSDDKEAADAYMSDLYPNATLLRSATFKYNCHSYAWHSTSSSNCWWMNDPSAYMEDGSYLLEPTASSGMRVYYYADHSGIVSSVSGSTKTIRSKWGDFGLYSHSESHCPYSGSPVLNTYWTRS